MIDGKAPQELLVGVDVGGTKVAVLVVNRQYDVLSEITLPTVLDGPEGTLSGIVAAIELSLALAGASTADVIAVGVGAPGRVDQTTGVVRQAVNLGWEEIPLGHDLSARLGVPCVLENDVRLAAVGVQRLMGVEATRHLAYVSVGTGIACGLILNGRVYRGAHGMAGEIGHMVIDPNGPLCVCGARGCLEALAAGPAIARLGEEAARSKRNTLLRDYQPVSAEAVYQAAKEGDAAALAIIEQVSAYLALALQQIIVAYDVECIVLGGGVSHDGQAFLEPVLRQLNRLRENSALTNEMLQTDTIRLLPPDYHAGTWGAVVLAGGGLHYNEQTPDGRGKGGERLHVPRM